DAKLQFDQERFLAAYERDPQAVEELFTLREIEENQETGERTVIKAGVGPALDKLLDRLTNPEGGPLRSRIDAIDRQMEANKRRIEAIEVSLEAKRARLEAQFLAMERALADMQTQSQALAS